MEYLNPSHAPRILIQKEVLIPTILTLLDSQKPTTIGPWLHPRFSGMREQTQHGGIEVKAHRHIINTQ